MVAGQMVIRMSVCMIPDDRDVSLGEGSIVAAAHGTVPGTVIGFELQPILFDVVFQPVAEDRMRFRIEINHVAGLRLVIISPNHIEVEVSLDLLDKRTALHEVLRAKQPFFLPVPEGKDDCPLRLHAGGEERTGYLEDGSHSGGVIVGSVVNLVAVEQRV